MVTRTKAGWEAYCRCPVVLAPSEIPEVMKNAIVAVEDKRYFEHSGVDVVSLLSVLKGGLSRGGSTIPMQLLKNLVFHDLRASDVITRLERKGAEVWYAGLFNEAVGKEELLAAYPQPDRVRRARHCRSVPGEPALLPQGAQGPDAVRGSSAGRYGQGARPAQSNP